MECSIKKNAKLDRMAKKNQSMVVDVSLLKAVSTTEAAEKKQPKLARRETIATNDAKLQGAK